MKLPETGPMWLRLPTLTVESRHRRAIIATRHFAATIVACLLLATGQFLSIRGIRRNFGMGKLFQVLAAYL